ncbi:hypothetical protein R1flu_001807 [Riccia fluitans]|uniref:Endonuclease/exonuclease/phosphatase n=1 Tax=Riccia fluitans TaxID=41844 RepID=A0ABD1Y7N7_9MARC
MQERLPGGQWLLGGDWNLVESFEDSVGPIPIQRGSERHKWNSLNAHFDLVDGWIEANKQEVPHFMCQKNKMSDWNKPDYTGSTSLNAIDGWERE